MLGKTEFFPLYPIVLTAVIAAITDVLTGKIYNFLTLPAIVLGIVASFSLKGWTGLGEAVLAVALAFCLYGWMYALRFLGGGDVKLLMAFGAWGGLYYTLEVALLGIFLGGLMAVGLLIIKGYLMDFMKRAYRFILVLMVKELEFEPFQINRSLTMPFGLPIAIAGIWTLYDHPLIRLGIL